MGLFSNKPKEKKPETITEVRIFACFAGTWRNLFDDPNSTIDSLPPLDWYGNFRGWASHLNDESTPLQMVAIYYQNTCWYIPTTSIHVNYYTRLMTEEEKAQRKNK
jgi:hypothetical protein